jgi:hypothetical protein
MIFLQSKWKTYINLNTIKRIDVRYESWSDDGPDAINGKLYKSYIVAYYSNIDNDDDYITLLELTGKGSGNGVREHLHNLMSYLDANSASFKDEVAVIDVANLKRVSQAE